TLLTLGDDFKFRLTRPSAFVDDGIKPVYRVTTRLGRYVDSTLSHPYLTIDGWRKLSELKVGDHVAAPRKIDVFGAQQLPDDEIESLARASRDGIIPPIVFQLARPPLAHFLVTLFSIGGQDAKVGSSATSERHARQVQHLLLRFGVISELNEAPADDEAASRQLWRLQITDARSFSSSRSDGLNLAARFNARKADKP